MRYLPKYTSDTPLTFKAYVDEATSAMDIGDTFEVPSMKYQTLRSYLANVKGTFEIRKIPNKSIYYCTRTA